MHGAGPLLNQAARILSKAAGGQVLVDGDTWAAIQVELAARDPSCPFTGAVLGEFKFKGIRLPVSLFQVAEKVRQVSLLSMLYVTIVTIIITISLLSIYQY